MLNKNIYLISIIMGVKHMQAKRNKKKWKPEDDWFHESRIQKVLKRHLEGRGYTVEEEANGKQKGPDLLLKGKNGRFLHIEVKGFPSDKYMYGPNLGHPKKTKPSTQAGHWFSEALLCLIIAKNRHPDYAIAMALPKMPEPDRYENLWREVKWVADKIGMICYWINQNNEVLKE
jgi:hypothetical protein